MGLFDSLLGGADGAGLRDLVSRYMQGAPHEGVGGSEALDAHEKVASQLSPHDYEDAAREAFARMEHGQREQFGTFLQKRAHRQDFNFPDVGEEPQFDDPSTLAHMVTHLHSQSPGLLADLLGGTGPGNSVLDQPFVRAALAGIVAMAVRRAGAR